MTKKDAQKIGRRIRKARAAAGLSQRQLASTDGLSFSYIARLESGERTASIDALIELAVPLGVTALALLTGDGAGHCPCCGRDG